MIHDIIMAVAVATATTTSANGKKNTENQMKNRVQNRLCTFCIVWKKCCFDCFFFLRKRKTTKTSFCCYWNWLQSVSFARSPIGVQQKISEVDFFSIRMFYISLLFHIFVLFFSLFLSFSNFIFASDSFVLGNQIAVTAISYV